MSKALPDGFPPADRSYSLYEDISYQDYWDNPQLDDRDALEQHLVSALLPLSGSRIVDIGGGYGRLAPCYLDRFEQVVICDGSVSLLREARSRWGDRIVTIAADVARLPFKSASFDCALTIRVLQHMHNLPSVLAEIGRIIALDGTMVFSYHNKRNASRILRHIAARGSANPFSVEPTELRATLISRHPRVIDALLSDAGFSPATYRGTALVSWLSSLSRRLWHRSPVGARWAPLMGQLRLAPWLIGKCSSRSGNPLLANGSVLDMLECPVCHGALSQQDNGFTCTACSRGYPVTDGILDFRS